MKYAYSNDEEQGWTGECETREDALAEARAEYDPDETVYTGEVVPLDLARLSSLHADRIVDDILDRLLTDFGEWAADNFSPTTAQQLDLDAKVAAVVREWLTPIMRGQFCVEKVQEHAPEDAQ
jgi:hypothetical protein